MQLLKIFCQILSISVVHVMVFWVVLKAAYFQGAELCDARTGARISPKQGTFKRAAVAQKIFLLLRWNVEIRGRRPGPD